MTKPFHNQGSAIVKSDERMPYPRICAHRGWSAAGPENSMPAFGAAVAMGASEVELDVFFTKDGIPVSTHESSLETCSDGCGKIWDYTLEELARLDFGFKFGPRFAGLRIPTFEDVLKKFAGHCILNVHLKTATMPPEKVNFPLLDRLICTYDAQDHLYLMSNKDPILGYLKEHYPHLSRCCGGGEDKWAIVDRAIAFDCKKVQLCRPFFNKEMIDRAHENGIVCNLFWCNDPEEAKEYLDMGIDTLLVDDYQAVAPVLEQRTPYFL